MAKVIWIKLTTGMFEDEKIDFIESLPEADAILIIWIKLLTQAGKNNMDGFIYLTEKIPYTQEMLSHKFRRPLNTVKLALRTLEELEMINFDDNGFLRISNWEKHQNIDGLDKIREDTRKRVAKHREKQKALSDSNVTVTLPVTVSNDIEEDKNREEENREDTTLTKTIKQSIIDEWNLLELQQLRGINSNTARDKSLKARIKEYSVDEIIQAIRSIDKSNFLQGVNDRKWVITFDWLLNPNNFIKVLEGNYIDKTIKKDTIEDDNPFRNK